MVTRPPRFQPLEAPNLHYLVYLRWAVLAFVGYLMLYEWEMLLDVLAETAIMLLEALEQAIEESLEKSFDLSRRSAQGVAAWVGAVIGAGLCYLLYLRSLKWAHKKKSQLLHLMSQTRMQLHARTAELSRIAEENQLPERVLLVISLSAVFCFVVYFV